MTVRGFLQRVAIAGQYIAKGEGDYHPGPYWLPKTGGWLPEGSPDNWWQLGMMPASGGQGAMVEACLSAYSQTVAMCPGDHWWLNQANDGREQVTTSALSRILRHPNAYQSISDFLLNSVRWLYSEGNAYALALRNDRYEVAELHLMNSDMSFPRVAVTGEIFYNLAGNDVISQQIGSSVPLIVPARDVLHVRLHTSRRFPAPLVGESPIVATYGDIGVSTAIAKQQQAFYKNEARPSAVLSTDKILDKDQAQFVKDKWAEESVGLRQGKTPILTAGLKVMPWSIGSKDAATAEILKLSGSNIALAFRIPLQLLGLAGTGQVSSTETLMQQWIASGLGFCLNHVEEAFGMLFGLKGQPFEYVELDTAALLRSQFKDRIEGLARGVQGGIYAPNEARRLEGLKSVKFGDEPRVQQQVVPLSAVENIPAAPAPGAAPPAAPAASDENKGLTDAERKRIRRNIRARHRLNRLAG